MTFSNDSFNTTSAPSDASQPCTKDTGPWTNGHTTAEGFSVATVTDNEPTDLLSDASMTPEPVLTRDMLPEALAGFVFDEAERIGVVPAMVAMPALVVCAGMIPDDIHMQVAEANTEHWYSARLWSACVGEPGTKKTPAAIPAIAPVNGLEAGWSKIHSEKMQKYRKEKLYYDKVTLPAAVKAAKEDDTKGADDMPLPPPKPAKHEAVVNDTTMEKLQDVLENNPRGVIWWRDELSGLLGGLDAYHPNGIHKDRAALLELWNGGRHKKQRVSGDVDIPNWSACINGGIQPKKLREVAAELASDGAFQRFLVYEGKSTGDGVDRMPNYDAIKRYSDLIGKLAALTVEDGLSDVKLSQAALGYWKDISRIAGYLRELPTTSKALVEFCLKIQAHFSRLLLTFHVIERADQPMPISGSTVGEDTARRAHALMKLFLIPSAARIYNEYCGRYDYQTVLLHRVALHIVEHGLTEISERDLQRNIRGLREATDGSARKRVLEQLVTAGWATQAGDAYKINFHVHALYAAYGRAERERVATEARQIAGATTGMRLAYPTSANL